MNVENCVYQNGMLNGMPQIAIRISDDELDLLDRAVAEGRFASRAAAVRAGLMALERENRNRAIAASYRDAYENSPPDRWFSEVNSEQLDERLSGAVDRQKDEL